MLVYTTDFNRTAEFVLYSVSVHVLCCELWTVFDNKVFNAENYF